MFESIGFVLLLLATLTAWRLERGHHPVAFVLSWFTAAEYILSRPVPAAMKVILTATYPAMIVGASYAASYSGLRSHVGVLFGSLGAVAGLTGLWAARYDSFALAMACLSLSCSVAGSVAIARTEAPSATRGVLILMLGGQACESVGWFSWANGSSAGYAFARLITYITFVAVIVIQVGEGAEWRLRWARLHGEHLEVVRGWVRTWRRAEIDNDHNKAPAPSSRT